MGDSGLVHQVIRQFYDLFHRMDNIRGGTSPSPLILVILYPLQMGIEQQVHSMYSLNSSRGASKSGAR